MATNLTIYAVAYITIQDALLLETASASMRQTSGSNPVFTVPKGYAGESLGSPMCEMEIESAVPFAAIEFDPSIVIIGLIPVEVGFVLGGKTAKTKGFIVEADYRHAVNSEAKQSLRYRGIVPKFE